MEALLPQQFKRVHISYIVYTQHISKVVMNQVLVGNTQIPISETYKDAFLQMLNERMI